MKIVPYLCRECYSAQISGMAFLNIQFGYTILGVALKRKDRFKPRWWTKIFPLFDIEVNKHSGQLDQVYKFRFRFMRTGVQYKTKGEARCKGGWRGDYGFKFIFCGKVLNPTHSTETAIV